MLPPELSSNLASLHDNCDRPAVSVLFELNPTTLEILPDKTTHGRSVIRNRAAMTYDQADFILRGGDGGVDLPEDHILKKYRPENRSGLIAGKAVDKSVIKDIRKALTILTNIQRKLKKERETAGAVDLQSTMGGGELKFSLDPITGAPVKVAGKKELEIHNTIAELMILANQYVGAEILR